MLKLLYLFDEHCDQIIAKIKPLSVDSGCVIGVSSVLLLPRFVSR